jgi:hypothetical protein
MPTDACVYFYECPACLVVSKPEPGGLLHVLFLWQLAVPSERHFAFLTDRTHLRLHYQPVQLTTRGWTGPSRSSRQTGPPEPLWAATMPSGCSERSTSTIIPPEARSLYRVHPWFVLANDPQVLVDCSRVEAAS